MDKNNLIPNHFETAGIYVEGKRSDFRFKKSHIASFMAGMLVPMGDPIPVFPGVKLDLTIDAAIRSNTLVVPPLDAMYIDFVAVWVPHRIVWTHFAQFLGENDVTAWTQSDTYVYPSVKLGVISDGLLDRVAYFLQDDTSVDIVATNNFLFPHYGLFYGRALGSESDKKSSADLEINILAARGYYFLWNYLFRDENYQRPVLFSKGDTGSIGEWGYLLKDYDVNATEKMSNLFDDPFDVVDTDSRPGVALLMPVNKFHDAMTSVLPQPQFGEAVELNLGLEAPLKTKDGQTLPQQLYSVGGNILFEGTNTDPAESYALGLDGVNFVAGSLSGDQGQTPVDLDPISTISRTNLVVDLQNATASTINQFRVSVMYQRYLEALARGGRRVPEYMHVIYGVKNTAATKDYPLLLTRSRYVLGVNQVVATADSEGSGWTSHLGDTGAFSYTILRDIPCCEQDFTEFGYLHICYCVRSPNRYSQMIQPHFLKSELADEYNPFFDHIGDVTVDNRLVNVLAKTAGNFGYQEAWWDERTQLSLAVGAVNKLYGSLKYWTIGEVYDEDLVTCTPSYLVFDPAVYNDMFVSAYYAYPQFIGEFCIRGKKIARMSAHSIPGIVGRI